MDGHWMRAPGPLLTDREALAQLEELGYADGYEPAGTATGVTVHERRRVSPGLNLYCSGHAPEAILMDMEGTVLHRWSLAYDQVPDPLPEPHRWFSGSWRRVRLLPDGSLLAIFENLGLVKIDRQSELEWWFDGSAHHDLDIAPDGTIWVLTRERTRRPELNPKAQIIEDFVSVLSPDGVEKRRISILDAFLNSPDHRHLLKRLPNTRGDLFHTNTIEILDHRLSAHGPHFRPGNLLISLRHIDTIAVLDPEVGAIVWAATGDWEWQHEPTALDTGRLLLFDNRGLGGASRVLELDPSTLETEWSYRGSPPESFFSTYCGAASRLANGNTLITDTCSGRAFEVTPDGETVWEFSSPHRAGAHGELVAALFEVIRVPETPVWIEDRIVRSDESSIQCSEMTRKKSFGKCP